ncbi:ribose ABC transport system permease protein RbsC [Vibrio variabilis]|uniref:Ribose ABC transport system permease protein RbsC n=1 Tax=Vibrio variabilis TaxID=990271 RepID=A0ABQ0JGE4_9VIBR|nr:ribose ABC transport system permease protein RbsC [Vibrio variabilis]
MESLKKALSQYNWLPIAGATFVMCIVLSTVSASFLSAANFQSILVQSSVTAIMAVGMTFIICTAGIDISVGAILFFTSSLFAQLMMVTNSYFIAFSASMSFACILGYLNGFLIVRFKISPLITTLATYTMYRGMAIHLTEAKNIPVPREMGFLGNGSLLGIPVPIVLMFLTLIAGAYLFNRTRFGLYVKAIGNSEQSARESNLPVERITMLVYLIGGVTTGIAALILLARVGGLQSGIGIGIEFTVIAAVVLGGTKLSGGTGTVLGSVIGAIFLVLIDNGLNLLNASPYVYDIVKGVVLLVAVVIDKLSVMRQQKSVLEERAKRIRSASQSYLQREMRLL